MNLPNINDPAWGWKDDNGLSAQGVLPKWEITIRCGWIEIDFYPTEKACTIASITLPAPEDNEQAKLIAEQSAQWLQDKLYVVAYHSKEVANKISRSDKIYAIAMARSDKIVKGI